MALIGGQINPALYPQPDYRNVIEADRMRAQSFVDVGNSISGVIKDFRESRKEEKEVNAANDASVKAIEAALILSDSYKIAGARDALQPFLTAASDANLSAVQKSALLAEGKAMIPNVFARFDKSQAMDIEKAQIASRNAPPLPEPLVFEDKFIPVGGGTVLVKKGSDGQTYDETGNNPVYDLGAFIRGEPASVYSDPGRAAIDPGTGVDTQGINNAIALSGQEASAVPVSPYYQGLGPYKVDPVVPLAQGILPDRLQTSDPNLPKIEVQDPSSFNFNQPSKGLRSRVIMEPGKEETTATIMTQEQVSNLTKQGAKVDALPMTDGRFVVSGVTMGGKPLVEVNTALSSQEGRAKEMDKSLFEQQKQLQGATANKDSIKEMIRLIDQGVKTGFAQDAIMQFNRAFGKDVSSSETFKSVAGDVAMGFINLTKGAISDKEMTYFTTVLAPNLGNTPEGNKKIGEFMLKAVGKAEKIEKTISEGMKQNKNAFDIDEDVRKIRNADDLLPSGPDDSFTPSKAKPPGVGLSQEAQDKLKEYLPK